MRPWSRRAIAKSSYRSYARAAPLSARSLRDRVRDQSVDESRPRGGGSSRAAAVAGFARHAVGIGLQDPFDPTTTKTSRHGFHRERWPDGGKEIHPKQFST